MLRSRLSQEFVAKNTRLAVSIAGPMLSKDRSLSGEHQQAALLGLWEAFVGTNPDTIDGVVVEPDGALRPVAGWDPAKGTFATWASRFISGRTRRSVSAAEGAFTGMSYNTWGQRPKVEQARADLARDLGRVPSIAEIAARAGVTEDTVRACTKAPPASLDAGLGDGPATLGDMIADTHSAPSPVDQAADSAEVELARRAQGIGCVDLIATLLRRGVVTPTRSVVQTADRLGIGRGSVAPAVTRAEEVIARQ